MQFLKRNWEKATVATGVLMASGYANAADPISTLLDGIDIAGVSAKIGSFALVVVGISIGIHGISVAKRVVNKI